MTLLNFSPHQNFRKDNLLLTTEKITIFLFQNESQFYWIKQEFEKVLIYLFNGISPQYWLFKAEM